MKSMHQQHEHEITTHKDSQVRHHQKMMARQEVEVSQHDLQAFHLAKATIHVDTKVQYEVVLISHVEILGAFEDAYSWVCPLRSEQPNLQGPKKLQEVT
jgi:hypothetical protein